MNRLNIDCLKRDRDFLKLVNDSYMIGFTDAECGRSFDRNTDSGIKNLNSLKEEFNAENVIYLKQIHSDIVLEYDDNSIKDSEADAIVTNKKNDIIGVFTADCVPVILIDEKTKACAAIHSGWKGTYKSITFKAVEKMKDEYGCKCQDIKAYIGPHIRKCCYEVSEELRDKFSVKKKNIPREKLLNGDNLNMEICIIDDLKSSGIKDENINSIDLCTYCSSDVKLHSYRKSNGNYGRMFSFVMLY